VNFFRWIQCLFNLFNGFMDLSLSFRTIQQFAEKQQTANRYRDESPFFEASAEKNVRFYEFTS